VRQCCALHTHGVPLSTLPCAATASSPSAPGFNCW
jgi:hypothetical protein